MSEPAATFSQVKAVTAARPSLARSALVELRDVARYRQLIRYTVSSSLQSESTGTVFGYLWWLLDPLLLMAVYVLLVDVILRRGGPDYPVFVLTAVIAWKYFQAGVRNSIGLTIGKERLMRQVAFPKSVLPLSAVLAEAIHFVFGVVVLIGVALAFGIRPGLATPFVLVVALVQLPMTLGVAYLLSALNVFFRDVAHLTTYAFRIWFYVSPSLYPLAAVPAEYRHVFELNPFATLFTAYRAVLMDGKIPDLSSLGFTAFGSVVVLVAGYLVFVRLERSFTKVA